MFACVCVWERKCVGERERETVMFKICRDRQRFCRQTERTSQSTAWLSQGKRRGGGGKKKKRHKRPSWLVPLHQPYVFPLTHGTQMKTDFKGEDEKHSLLLAKCFTMGPCANTVVLSEKWTTVELTNTSSLRCASHTAWVPHTRPSKGRRGGALHFKKMAFVACSYAFVYASFT